MTTWNRYTMSPYPSVASLRIHVFPPQACPCPLAPVPPPPVSQLGTRCPDVIIEVLWYYVTIVMLMSHKETTDGVGGETGGMVAKGTLSSGE